MAQYKRTRDTTPSDVTDVKKQRVGQAPLQVRVFRGRIAPANINIANALQPVNGSYPFTIGSYFTLEAHIDGVQQAATWQVTQANDLVKVYTPVLAQTNIELHTQQEMTAATFTGVWWRTGDKTITATMGDQAVTVTFGVIGPTLDNQMAQFDEAAKIGQAQVGQFSIPLNSPAREWLVLAATNVANRQVHGIDISYDFTPQLLVGSAAFIQLIQTSRQVREIAGPQVKLSQSNTWMLDNGHGPNSCFYQNMQRDISQGAQISMNDGPAQELGAAIDRAQISEQFATYLMYRPVGPNAETTWVPLDKLTWSWRGQATHQNGGWVLGQCPPAALSGQPPTPFPNNIDPHQAFPEWTGSILSAQGNPSLPWQDQQGWHDLF